jgi:hypothetical protein
MSFEQKYLKYKQKYQELKRQLGVSAHTLETENFTEANEYNLTETPTFENIINTKQVGGNDIADTVEQDYILSDTPVFQTQQGGNFNIQNVNVQEVANTKHYSQGDVDELNSTTDLSEINNTEDIEQLFKQYGNGRGKGKRSGRTSEQSSVRSSVRTSSKKHSKHDDSSSSISSSGSSESDDSSDSLSHLDSDSDGF